MAGDFVTAEALYRAGLVQYLGWVHDHTLPAIANKIPIADELVKVDRDALMELAYCIADCMARLRHAANIIPFLNHLESMVPIVGFEKDAAYLRSTWLYVALDDQPGARRELQKVGPILEYGRRPALEVYLDVLAAELTEREKINIAENIISKSESDWRSRVQYTAVKALALLQIGEAEHGMEELRALLAEIESSDQFDAADTFTVWQLAKAWSLYGNFKNDDTARFKAEQLLLSLPRDTLTPFGKTQLDLELGWVLRDREKYTDSANAIRRSQEIIPSPVAKIHLVHSLALTGEAMEARTLLRELEVPPFAVPLSMLVLG